MKKSSILVAAASAWLCVLLPSVASAETAPSPVSSPPESSAPADSTPRMAPLACSANLHYFYNSNMQGASAVYCSPVADLAGHTYNTGPGLPGYGQPVKNNAASIRHISIISGGLDVFVYYNSGYKGFSNVCVPGCAGNLTPELKNQNASHRWG